MSTISVQLNTDGIGVAKFTLTYSNTWTNTTDTVSVSSIKLETYTWGGSFSYTATYDGTTLSSGSLSAGEWSSASKSISGSKSITKTHSSQTKKLQLKASGSGLNNTNSITIEISARPSYTVTFNANGGSGAPSAQTKWHDETLTLSSSKPSRSGYAFWRWNTNTSNTGTSYSPGGSYTSNANTTLYAIWNPIIYYNGQSGSNIPASQTKTFNQTLTLSSTVPTRTGYRFVHWNTNPNDTGTSYSPGASYTSNYTATLYAIWKKVALAPTISSISVVRCDSSGRTDDSGTYCKLTARWSVDTSTESGMASNQGRVTGTIKVDGSSTSRSITFDSGTSGTSGTATAIIPNCDTDEQYLITVAVTNTIVGTGDTSVLSTSRSDILTRAFFTMDFAAGGNGIGMGVAAPTDGFECGLDAQFDGDVEVFGSLTAPNLTMTSGTGSDVFSSSGNWGYTESSTYGYKYGPFVEVSLYVTTNVALTAGTQYSVGSLTSTYRSTRPMGFSNTYGVGIISSTSVTFKPTVAVSAGTSMYIGALYMQI